MRLVSITSCQPGMKLAKTIYSDDGQVLLAAQVELTGPLIRRLGDYRIGHVYIDDPRTSDLEAPEPLSEETRRRALSGIRSGFRDMMEAPQRKGVVTYPYIGKSFKAIMSMILDDLLASKDAMIMLMNIGTTDHYLYQHSLNVCVYTTLLGIGAGYSRDQLTVLGMGALLHDVGKTRIPSEVLFKPGRLSDEEFAEMKRHTTLGYELLKEEPNIPLLTAHCALQHHERLNGSGYPRGLTGSAIHDYAKWIGIVDSYDAMTASRVYKSALLPHQAVEELYGGSGVLYEQDMLQTFKERVILYPVGLTVELNTGERGVVVDYNSDSPHRPIVRILDNEAGEPLRPPVERDLSRELSLMITAVNNDALPHPDRAPR
ncbi:HD-GYP domain-containing protein [Paenibacillus sp. IB182496]|uniref:HD-GYP domain-containing protein n=1 Tax=Paenibacillus sabuli TaxID=2772509 RepID=A0A927GU34_9BACL|nr:HD-GYP domain-containing protein [Paenibacillus sabuli]MBD2848253.1 HD-GYP domain-containing protein [Paenibacillus sabuli]